jgi:hypothetical protein
MSCTTFRGRWASFSNKHPVALLGTFNEPWMASASMSGEAAFMSLWFWSRFYGTVSAKIDK